MAAEAMTPFEYNSLETTRHIRAVELLPGRPTDNIEARLLTVDFDVNHRNISRSPTFGAIQF